MTQPKGRDSASLRSQSWAPEIYTLHGDELCPQRLAVWYPATVFRAGCWYTERAILALAWRVLTTPASCHPAAYVQRCCVLNNKAQPASDQYALAAGV